MEIILVGFIVLLSKLVELFCNKKKYNEKKSFLVGISTMLCIFLITYIIALIYRDNELGPLSTLDILIAVGVAFVVSIGVGYKCMLASH